MFCFDLENLRGSKYYSEGEKLTFRKKQKLAKHKK